MGGAEHIMCLHIPFHKALQAGLIALQTAQKFGSKKTFTATLSNRVETTYKEAEAFSVELKHALKQIRALQTATAGVWRL